MTNRSGIYIHIPFCRRTCYYCHFTKFPYDQSLANQYVAALSEEIRLRAAPTIHVDTIYFGGGSPAVIGQKNIRSILKKIDQHFDILPEAEITIELNPDDSLITPFSEIKKLGFNRVSLGTQSFHDKDLTFLKRHHSASTSRKALEQLKSAGIENINFDYIIGLPDQSVDTLESGFEQAMELQIPHISVYLLEGVKRPKKCTENRDSELYYASRDLLSELGYNHYEISNYAKTGYSSKHNLKYWENQPYIGVGLSASGFLEGKDYKNRSEFRSYFTDVNQGRPPVDQSEIRLIKHRQLITGLRKTEGVPIELFKQNRTDLELLLSENILIRNGQFVRLHPDRLLLLNEVLANFI